VHSWASRNFLEINASKSKCLIISKRPLSQHNIPMVKIDNKAIEFSKNAKNLGIVFNSNLSWGNHIATAVAKVYGLLRTLWSLQSLTPQPIRLLLCKTYLVPILLYGVELFANCDYESKRKLTVAFNNIARYVYNLKRFDHISEHSRSIFSLSFENFLKLRTLIFLHRIIYSQKPLYLYNRLRFTNSPRDNKIVPFRHSLRLSERQFFLFSVHLWNLLPSHIQFTANVDKFKKLVGEFLENA